MMNKKALNKILIGEFSIGRVVRSLLVIYLCVLVYVYFFSDSMMFLPQSPAYKDNGAIVKLETTDGVSISARYLKHAQAEFTILYSHGNAEDIGDIEPVLKEFFDQGYSIIGYDYHGYGTSAGKPAEDNVYRDIEAVYRYLTVTEGISPGKIIAAGYSLGTGPTTYLAARHEVAGVILQAPFLTAFRVVTRLPLLPFDRFRNNRYIKAIDMPVLVIHGTADAVVPFWHGEQLYELANEPKYHLWIEGAGHFDFREKAGRRYWDTIDYFKDRL